MNEDKAAVALRLSIRATIGATPGEDGSLRNIITDIFPNGALCFVDENRALYNLDKASTATPDNVSVVQPIAGPGRWLLLSQGAGATSFVEIVGTAENGVTTSGSANFLAVDDTNFDWQPTGAPAGWALTVAGGVITYNGTETVRARVTFTGSVFISAESGGTVWGAVSHNGDLIGTDPTTSFILGPQTTEAGASDLPQAITAQRTLVLAPGDTLQIVVATDTGEDMILSRGTMAVLLA